ncbi:ATP-dependent DNA helicase RecQ [Gammaproteobacteria bacterium 45_16_T64]|nr:ATP-dependent DNA helicase RecQ [Gammaproteobacteria bacterium 45_16_T64]
MENNAETILQNTFGYSAFRGNQKDIIDTVTQGGDALVLMPTGGGKSLCYQIPMLLRQGVGIVISPLIALMEDQVSALTQLGVRARYLNSMLSREEAYHTEQAVLEGNLDVLYVAPERLLQPRTIALLKQANISLFAIDEAHCVSQWGHDFRADYLQLSILQEQFPHVPRLALTATADNQTRQEILMRLGLEQGHVFVSGFDRPNIQYRITHRENGNQQLLRFLKNEHASDAGIVYCLSRKKVESTAEWLSGQGFDAIPYHAGLPMETRKRHQERFLRNDGVIVVATIAFGMGIDKPDVRFVAHLDLPKSVESYYQETGRAGRDGEPSTAWMVYGLQDVIKLKQMRADSQASEQFKRIEHQRLESMLGLCEITSCRREALLNYFDDDSTSVCGNCDNCLNPAESWDATDASRKALSCIFRTGQRFGVSHLVDVLRGADNAKVKQFEHEKVSTFGIGKDLSVDQWKSVYRQLIARGHINVDMEAFGALRLTDKCRQLLRGDESISLRKDRVELKGKTRKVASQVKEQDRVLWEALRAERKRLADEQGVPPYIIFGDVTLMEMMERRPGSAAHMLQISGIGQHKLDKYGDVFLAILADHGEVESAPPPEAAKVESYLETLALLKAGMDVPMIAEQRGVKEKTIFIHLEKCIVEGEIEVQDVVQLPEEDIDRVRDALFAHADEDNKIKLTPVYEDLEGHYSYEIIGCIRAEILRDM